MYIVIVLLSGMVALMAGDGSAKPIAGAPDISSITGRTHALQAEVDDKFTVSQSLSPPPFQYHGEVVHKLMEIPDLKLVDLVISNAIGRGEKYVYFLDIGAGDFQWLRTVSKHINNAYSEFGIVFHLWGVTERKTGNTRTEEVLNGYTVECVRRQDGCCKFHQYTKFPIENIEALLTGPQKKFDLIVSNCTFPSMRDPANTFIQVYNLLRLNTGLLMVDSFNVDVTPDSSLIPDHFIDFPANSLYRKFDVFLDALGVDYMTRSIRAIA